MTTEEFFRAMYGQSRGLLEIRLIAEGTGAVSQRFFPLPAGIPVAAKFAQEQSGKTHVFFGVFPRNFAQGRDNAITNIQCLFADVDAKDFAGGEREIEKRIAALAEQGLGPTISVRSGGGGRHLYWMLQTPANIPVNDQTNRNGLRNALWAIGDALGIQPKANVVHDLARVLRVPGTTNIKAKYAEPLPCEVESINLARIYRPKDFSHLIREHQRPVPVASQLAQFTREAKTVENPETLLDGLTLSREIRELIHKGADKGQRSEADQRVVTALLRASADADRIRDIFTNFKIGEKMSEHPYPDRYLATSIGKAQAWLEAHKDERQQAALPEPDITTLDAYLSAVLPARYKTYIQGNDEKKHLATLVELAKHRAPAGAVYQAAQIAAMGQGDSRAEYAERIYRKAMFIAQQARSQTASRPTPAVRDRAAGMER